MAEFSAQDAIRSRYDPELKRRAVRLFLGLSVALVAVAGIGYLQLAWFGLTDSPLLMLLAVGGPIVTSAMMVAVAGIITIGTRLGPFLLKYAAMVFWGGVAGAILAGLGRRTPRWLCRPAREAADPAGALECAASCSANRSPLEEIQRILLTRRELEENETALYYKKPIPYPPHRGCLAAHLLPALAAAVSTRARCARAGRGDHVHLRCRHVRHLVGAEGGRAHPEPRRAHARGRVARLGTVDCRRHQAAAEGGHRTSTGRTSPLFRLAPYLAFVPAVCVFIALAVQCDLGFPRSGRGADFHPVDAGHRRGRRDAGGVGVEQQVERLWGHARGLPDGLVRDPDGHGAAGAGDDRRRAAAAEIGDMQAGGFHTWLAFTNPFTFAAACSYFWLRSRVASAPRSICPRPRASWSRAITPSTAGSGSRSSSSPNTRRCTRSVRWR